MTVKTERSYRSLINCNLVHFKFTWIYRGNQLKKEEILERFIYEQKDIK